MATLTLTGNTASLLRLAKQITAVCAEKSDTKSISFTLDDADFSVTGPDGVKRGHK